MHARARAVIQSISSPLLGDHIIDMPRLTSECAEKVLRDMRHEPDISSFILFSLTMHGLIEKDLHTVHYTVHYTVHT